MKKYLLSKTMAIGVILLFVGASVLSSVSGDINNIENVSYFRSKDLRSYQMERMNTFRNKDFSSNQIENILPIFDGSLRGWSITEVVSTESTETSYDPCVAYDSNGDIHVVWMDETNYGGSGSDSDIYYKMKPSGGSWTATEVVSSESDIDSFYPSLGIDSNGDIHVVWDDASETDDEVYYKMKPSGGSWTSVELISTEGSDFSGLATLAVESDGTVHVAWDGATGSGYDIFYKKKPSGGSWTDAEAIPLEESNYPFLPMLAVEPDGTLHLAWDDSTGYGGSGSDEDIFYKNKPSGGSWSATEVVSTESAEYSYHPTLEVDSNGDVHIIWEELGSEIWDICYKKKPSGGSWTSVEVVSLYSGAFISDLAVESDGTVHVAWDELNMEGDFMFDIFYKKKPSGGSWTDAEVVSTESDFWDAIYPNVAVESDGTVHVVWVDMNDYAGSGEDFDIFYKNKVGENQPPETPSIDGETSGKAGEDYEYIFNSTDPDGDSVMYFIDWGDNNTEWTEYSPSGTEVKVKHSWSEKGEYTIKAKAKDIHDAESDWETLEVTMPKNKVFNFNFNLLSWLFERFPHMFPILRHLLEL